MSERPRLRAIEAFPVEQDGAQMVALRDPAGYTASMLLLPMPVVEIVALCDGAHSLEDIQAEIMRRHGELVEGAQIERLIATLDEHGFMDSPGFARRRAAHDRTFRDAPTRPAAHAGGAYADDPSALRAAMDACFQPPGGPGAPRAGAPSGSPVRGLIAPHIDFHRGGPAYAWAYRDLAEAPDADVFVIFGTCHAGMADPFALTRKDYETPLGAVPVDRDLIDAVAARAGQDCFASELAHRSEHSIEFQAVFLRYLYRAREITILPVLASFAHEAMLGGRRPEDDPRVPRFLDAVAEGLAASGRRAVVIAGADLAHVGPRFGDPAPISEPEMERVEREDRAMLASITGGDARAFFDAVAADNDRRRICGFSPIYALLRTLSGARGDLRIYGQWPDPQAVVTYASVTLR
ncbi:MAG: AmmeMemoRadiSam system protein B [Candidatus Rokubacteria bacterium]|nr:AmmeMemoRadiSam system protein B [Candidatus Rokubacteria bacterium]MBI3826565.1 AmmeMemoRadiSam system protein B [Candidatus Rokubacteria bacterium]